MRLSGRRRSDNVNDARGGMSTGGKLGIGGLLFVGLITYFTTGGDLGKTVQTVAKEATQQMTTSGSGQYKGSPREDSLAVFVSQILAGTEDVWTDLFKQYNLGTYRKPKLKIFKNATTSGCGSANASTGPFYCSADETVYIDLSFYDQMEGQLKAGGDFAYAYVIAHEVGHHVQNLMGILDQEREAEARARSEKAANELSVRLELQADFFAGIWAHYDNEKYNSLETGDVEEGMNAASAIGDDRLQMQSRGYTVPESFNHGTSAQRSRWLMKGLRNGNLKEMDTFSINYSDL
ncbi:MAG: neutral zinc metallopeptidase [Paludibacteraceae bacterium]|nr:neutral zinc metallopeptidase [Paludibacteraceae bacterium]